MADRNRYFLVTTAALFAACVLAGCTSKQDMLEKEEAYRKIGIDAMESENYTAAIEAFDNALSQADKIGANEVDICYYKAAAQFAAGDLTNSVGTYDTLLEYDNANSDAYFLRGCVYLNMSESGKAQEDFAKAVKFASDDDIYLDIYNSLSGAGYEEEGREYLEKALEKKPGKKARNYTVKGKIYFLEGELGEAQKCLQTAVEKGDVDANLYLAQTYEALGQTDSANNCINAYIEVYPKSSVAYNQLGKKALLDGDYKAAVSYFNEGLSLEEVTNEQELRSNLIAAYEYGGDFETAREYMQAYVQDYPEDKAAAREYFFLGKNRNEETQIE